MGRHQKLACEAISLCLWVISGKMVQYNVSNLMAEREPLAVPGAIIADKKNGRRVLVVHRPLAYTIYFVCPKWTTENDPPSSLDRSHDGTNWTIGQLPELSECLRGLLRTILV